MRIGIITVYEPITNFGSYLQAYALRQILTDLGHDVYIIAKNTTYTTIIKAISKLSPKREFFLRIQKALYCIKDLNQFKIINRNQISYYKLDCLIFGSDEIWNLENPYFRDNLFWGVNLPDIPKIAYAISTGAASKDLLLQYSRYIQNLGSFKDILARDNHTKTIIEDIVKRKIQLVCDPTLLLPVQHLTRSIAIPKKPYLLVYTYGVDSHLSHIICQFAQKNNLLIVSPCFWHLWADKVIECSALQFSYLIANAEFVFTSTFHGAIFTLLNHKRCCILPVREKVRDVVDKLKETQRLIKTDCSLSDFSQTMELPFNSELFEKNLATYKSESLHALYNTLSNIN